MGDEATTEEVNEITDTTTSFITETQPTVNTEQETATPTDVLQNQATTTQEQQLLEAPTLVSPVDVINLVQSHILRAQSRESEDKPTERVDVAQDKKDDEVSLASLERAGGYGSKLNSKFNVNANSIQTPQFRLRNQIPTRRYRPTKLVENASKMVSGKDVLAINQVINEGIANATESSASPSNQETKIIGLSMEQSNTVEYNQPTTATSVENEMQTSEEQDSLSKRPIVVADFEQETQQGVSFSTTPTHLESESIPTISEVLVTPKPESSNFLVPYATGLHSQQQTQQSQTVGVQLQPTQSENGELPVHQISQIIQHSENSPNKNYQIEVQKSQPYYLGKFEYVQYPAGYSDEKMIGTEERNNMTAEKIAMENIQIGTTLLNFPVPNIETVPVKPTIVYKEEPYAYERPEFVQLLPQEAIKQQFTHEIESNDITVQQLPSPITNYNFKVVPDQVPAQGQNVQVPLQQLTVPLPSPSYTVFQTKYVNTPFQVPAHIPYPIEKRIPVAVEKQVKIPYTVTKYIERPYPVHVPVPQPYPVEKIVKQPYPVEVRVEKVVEKKVPVPHYIEKPVPVEKIVEKPVTQYIEKPYPVAVAQPFYIQVPVDVPRAYPFDFSRFVHKTYGLPQAQPTEPIPQLVTIPQARPLYQPPLNQDQKPVDSQQIFTQYTPTPTRNYLPVSSTKPDCDQDGASSTKNAYHDYVGLLPPRFPAFRNVRIQQQPVRYRNVRSDFGKNLRIEYGFLPPMVPSLEIDEYGNPIDKKE